jgi:hypothetical protein
MKAVYQNRVLKSEMLKQVKTNLWAYSEDGEPLTDNVVCWRFRARNNGKSRLPIFSICDPIQNHILLVGANGCSPEEGEALPQARSRRQKGASLLTQASLCFAKASSGYTGLKEPLG